MIRAFTGPTDLTARQRTWVVACMAECQMTYPADIWRSGCAYGVDTIAAYIARSLYDDVDLELYVPHAYHNGTLVRDLAQYSNVIRCARRKTPADCYRLRNTAMVCGGKAARQLPDPKADHLLAFVTRRQFYRSGEWMTINIAKSSAVHYDLQVIPS